MLRSDSSADDVATGTGTRLERAGIDAVAVKPTEHDLDLAGRLPAETLAIDYEGRENLPDADRVRSLAADGDVVVTTPVRADGFDPLGDDSLLGEWVPGTARRAVVAGHPAYLTEAEQSRAIAPRIGAALRAAGDAWVGTEGIERVATATGGAQYELLSADTDRAVRSLRAVGYDGDVAVYAPTVLAADEDAVLDAIGDYVARRGPVRRALPDGAATDSSARGRAREVLLRAVEDYAVVGDVESVRARTDALREAGVTHVVGYPARGLDEFLG